MFLYREVDARWAHKMVSGYLHRNFVPLGWTRDQYANHEVRTPIVGSFSYVIFLGFKTCIRASDDMGWEEFPSHGMKRREAIGELDAFASCFRAARSVPIPSGPAFTIRQT